MPTKHPRCIAKPKTWAGWRPQQGPSTNAPTSAATPWQANDAPTQEFGGPVTARLQPRRNDPEWLRTQAARNDHRKDYAEANDLPTTAGKRRTFDPNIPIAGIPPPGPRALGSPQLMRSWEESKAASTIRAPNFQPGSNTKIIMGRPVQCICISHEDAAHLENDGYIPWLVRPLQPQTLLGYNANRSDTPSGHRHYCVTRWFQVVFFCSSWLLCCGGGHSGGRFCWG